MTPNDPIGQTYNRWTVKSFSHKKNYHKFYNCECKCGNKGIIDLCSLKSGNSKSCGCLRNETTRKRATTHGMSQSRINRIYRNIKTRCFDTNTPIYEKYGAKGITVCEQWLGENGFKNFLSWSMENGYRDELTIDRIDGKGNYEPTNCRWVTPKVQANNISTNVVIEYNGTKHTVSEWSDITGINRRTIEERYKRGLPVEEVFSKYDLRFEKEVMLCN